MLWRNTSVVPRCSEAVDSRSAQGYCHNMEQRSAIVMAAYTASKSQTQGRPGWSINFRHPLRRDARNKPGLKVRRGLGTTDTSEADELVGQMNQLLGDERWWSIARRAEALAQFHPN